MLFIAYYVIASRIRAKFIPQSEQSRILKETCKLDLLNRSSNWIISGKWSAESKSSFTYIFIEREREVAYFLRSDVISVNFIWPFDSPDLSEILLLLPIDNKRYL